jgi:hypothetical protein
MAFSAATASSMAEYAITWRFLSKTVSFARTGLSMAPGLYPALSGTQTYARVAPNQASFLEITSPAGTRPHRTRKTGFLRFAANFMITFSDNAAEQSVRMT